MSRGQLTYYFPAKDDILLAVFDHMIATMHQRAGAGIAGFHVYLEKVGTLECPGGIYGLGSAPQQSLGVYIVLAFLLVADALRRGGGPVVRFFALLLALVVGGGIAYGCFVSVPRPVQPMKAYPGPPKVCRPPYHE